jgi:SAM-dependent methyltransferase
MKGDIGTKVIEPDQCRSWDRLYSGPAPLWKGPINEGFFPSGSARVLELGCGNGKTAATLVRTSQEVVGLDFSRPALEVCRREVSAKDLHLVRGDLRGLPFADRTFDLVVAFHVLGHLWQEERKDAIVEARRVLRPGGSLALRAFSVRDMRYGLGREVEPGTFLRGTDIRTHFFTRHEIDDLMIDLTTLSLDEILVPKRYGGVERSRVEWAGLFTVREPYR